MHVIPRKPRFVASRLGSLVGHDGVAGTFGLRRCCRCALLDSNLTLDARVAEAGLSIAQAVGSRLYVGVTARVYKITWLYLPFPTHPDSDRLLTPRRCSAFFCFCAPVLLYCAL